MSELLFTADIDISILEQKLKKVDTDFTTIARDAAQVGSVIDKIFKQSATDSISGMALKLDELQNAYNNLSKADRATQGGVLITEINKLSASIEAAKNQFGLLETAAAGSIDSMVTKLSELQRQFTALSASDRGGDIGSGLQKEIYALSTSIEAAKTGFVSMEQVAEDSINGMIDKLIALQRQYNNLSAADRVTVGSGIQKEIQGLSTSIEEAKKQFVSLANVSEDSVQGMIAKLQELNRQFGQLSAADRDGTIGIKMAQDMAALSNQIENVNLKMRAMNGQAKTSTSSLYGLNYSVQQIGRELPNIAYGFPLFIMAISNNLPILADSIQMARKENELLKASNQASTPVWKQVASSIFSWQTAMIAGITMLTVFGSKIPGLIQDLFSMGKGLKLTSEELKGLNESFAKSAGSELGKLKGLFDALENAKEGTVEYTEAKGAIIDQYGKNLEGMDAEIRSLTDVKGAYEELTKSIYETAKAKSLQDLRADLGEKMIKETTPEFENLSKLLAGGVNEIYRQTIIDAARYGKELSIDAQRVVDSFTVKKTVNSDQIVGTDNLGNVQFGKKVIDYNPVVESMNKIKKIQDDTNSAYSEAETRLNLIYGSNTQSKVKNLVKELEVQLKVAQAMPQDTTAHIAERNQAIKAIEDQIKAYKELGIEKDKDGKFKAVDDQLKAAKEKLTNAIIANDQKEIKFQATKIALLEKEKELREWIAYEAVAFAKGDITQADRNNASSPTAIVSKGLSPILQKGVLGTNAKGQVIEITAVDNTGPTFKKVGLEIPKLNKKIKEGNEQAAKDQEEIDKEKKQRQEEMAQQALQFMDNMLAKYAEQLGMTEEEAGLISSLAEGDYFAAAFNMLGVVSKFFKAEKDGVTEYYSNLDAQTKKLIENLDLVNKSLTNIGTSGSFRSFNVLSAELVKLKNDAARLNDQIVVAGSGGGRRGGTTTQGTGTNGTRGNEENRARTIFDLSKQTSELYAEIEELTYKLLDPNLTEEQRTTIIKMLGSYNSIIDSINSSVQNITGTTISDLSNSLIDAFLSGEDAAEKWGETVDGIIKNVIKKQLVAQLLTKPITEAVNTLINDSSDGLSPDEASKFTKSMDALYSTTKPIIDQINNSFKASGIDLITSSAKSSTPLTGITASLTEETGSLLAGLITGMRIDTKQTGIDIKSMLNFSQNQLEIMDQQLSVMSQIEKNTRPLSRLENMENTLLSMDKTLKHL